MGNPISDLWEGLTGAVESIGGQIITGVGRIVSGVVGLDPFDPFGVKALRAAQQEAQRRADFLSKISSEFDNRTRPITRGNPITYGQRVLQYFGRNLIFPVAYQRPILYVQPVENSDIVTDFIYRTYGYFIIGEGDYDSANAVARLGTQLISDYNTATAHVSGTDNVSLTYEKAQRRRRIPFDIPTLKLQPNTNADGETSGVVWTQWTTLWKNQGDLPTNSTAQFNIYPIFVFPRGIYDASGNDISDRTVGIHYQLRNIDVGGGSIVRTGTVSKAVRFNGFFAHSFSIGFTQTIGGGIEARFAMGFPAEGAAVAAGSECELIGGYIRFTDNSHFSHQTGKSYQSIFAILFERGKDTPPELRRLNIDITRYIDVFDPSTQNYHESASRNCYHIAEHMIQQWGSLNADLPTLRQLATDHPGDTFDGAIGGEPRRLDSLNEVLNVGHAAAYAQDGGVSFVKYDVEQMPTRNFTEGEGALSNLTIEINMDDRVDGFEVEYFDEAKETNQLLRVARADTITESGGTFTHTQNATATNPIKEKTKGLRGHSRALRYAKHVLRRMNLARASVSFTLDRTAIEMRRGEVINVRLKGETATRRIRITEIRQNGYNIFSLKGYNDDTRIYDA